MHQIKLHIVNVDIIYERRYWELNGLDHRPYHPAQQDHAAHLYSWWICGICIKKKGYIFGSNKKANIEWTIKWLEAYNKINIEKDITKT